MLRVALVLRSTEVHLVFVDLFAVPFTPPQSHRNRWIHDSIKFKFPPPTTTHTHGGWVGVGGVGGLESIQSIKLADLTDLPHA